MLAAAAECAVRRRVCVPRVAVGFVAASLTTTAGLAFCAVNAVLSGASRAVDVVERAAQKAGSSMHPTHPTVNPWLSRLDDSRHCFKAASSHHQTNVCP